MTILKQDSHDLHIADHFDVGGIIPDTIEFDKGLTNPIEANGGEYCTALSATDVGTDQVGILFNVDDLWALTPHGADGANPRDSMGAVVKYGMQPMNGGPRDTRWTSYMRADGNSGDYGATLQASMIATQSSTTVATPYYQEWTDTSEDGVLPVGKTLVSGHDYKISGWRTVNGVVQYHVKFWTSGFKWMPKDVLNLALDAYGSGAYIPTTVATTSNQISFLQKCLDFIVNLLFVNNQTTMQTISGTHPNIIDWANAVKQEEGWTLGSPSYINQNPGNLGYTTLTASWGGVQSGAKTDGGHFCKFPDYDTGFKALCNFLTLGAEDELKAFHNARTLGAFSSVYGNTGPGYGEGIAKTLGVSVDTPVSTFLS